MKRIILAALVGVLVSGCQTTNSIPKTTNLTPLTEPFSINFGINYFTACEIYAKSITSGSQATSSVTIFNTSVKKIDGEKASLQK